MNPENDAKLRAMAPHLFPSPLINLYPIQCGDGWFSVLAVCFMQLDRLIAAEPPDKRAAYRAVQVKEKFGTLRVYQDKAPTNAMGVVIEEAERMSAKTCDVCGKRGESRSGAGVSNPFWIRVRCDEHVDWREPVTHFAHQTKDKP